MARHIIQRLYVDATCDATREPFRFRDEVSELCKNRLIQATERLFDAMIPTDKFVRISKLTVDVGDIPFENWEQVLIDRVIGGLRNKLTSIPPSMNDQDDFETADESVTTISHERNVSSCVLHFLKTGVLPWYSPITSQYLLNRNMKELMTGESFMKELVELLRLNDDSVRRLVAQFDTEVADMIIHNLETNAGLVRAANLFSERLTRPLKWGLTKQKRIILESLIYWCLGKRTDQSSSQDVGPIVRNIISQCSDDEIRDMIRRASDDYGFEFDAVTITGFKRQEDHKRLESVKVADGDLFYVTNAGLALLHPFLPLLFSHVGYTHNDEWLSEEIRERALMLTQFLISGDDLCPEFDLMLNKVLLGYPFSKTVKAEMVLSDFEKGEAADLLTSVIGHWAALRNTSLDGLRATFLKRDGKLSCDNTRWLLQVEQKTVDILLGKLPWSFSIVKTPWMDQMLHVEWA